MAIKVTVIRIFVASPAELSEERIRLEEVVRELNLAWGNTLGLRLELVKWETHAYPGVGPDPQIVIDEEVGEEYEIFVGMLWTKFGTPTSDAGSGTEHEFQRAYSRHMEHPKQLRIMFYFKDGQVPPLEVDAEQLLKVQQFRKRLGQLGSLYWIYKTSDEFANFIRVHLAKQLQTWGKGWGTDLTSRSASNERPSAKVPEGVPALGPELGFLDLMEIVQDGFPAMNEVVERMGKAVETLGQQLTQRTAEVNQGHSMDQSSRIRHWKRVSNALANELEDFCAKTESDIPLLGKLFRQTSSALARGASMWREFGAGQHKEGIEGIITQMRAHVEQLALVRTNIQAFRDTVKISPSITTSYIAARNRTVAVIDKLDGEYKSMAQHTAELGNGLEDLMKDQK